MTTFNDIFKSSFLNNITAVSLPDMILTLVIAFCLGMFIFLVYKKTYAGVMYSATFGVTIVALTMITSMTILAVTSNVVLSLGMVGALSIVRFRTAIKEPMDLVFLFWSISAGIVVAAGMLPLAVVGSAIIGIMLIVLANRKGFTHPYILVLSTDGDSAEHSAETVIRKSVEKYVLKSKSVRAGSNELNYEVRLAKDDTSFVNNISNLAGVKSVMLVSYNGEYMG